jgi:hypothetical protein
MRLLCLGANMFKGTRLVPGIGIDGSKQRITVVGVDREVIRTRVAITWVSRWLERCRSAECMTPIPWSVVIPGPGAC